MTSLLYQWKWNLKLKNLKHAISIANDQRQQMFIWGPNKSYLYYKKKLMIDLQTVKDAYQSLDVTNVALARSEYNIADSLIASISNYIMIGSH